MNISKRPALTLDMPASPRSVNGRLSDFFQEEDGAVTVDYVMFTGAIFSLGVSVAGSVAEGAGGLGQRVENRLSSFNVTLGGLQGLAGSGGGGPAVAGLDPDIIEMAGLDPAEIEGLMADLAAEQEGGDAGGQAGGGLGNPGNHKPVGNAGEDPNGKGGWGGGSHGMSDGDIPGNGGGGAPGNSGNAGNGGNNGNGGQNDKT